MPVELIVVTGVLLALLAVVLVSLLFLQWRAGRTYELFQQQLIELSRGVGDSREKQEALARLLSEGQVKNLETLQKQFAVVVDTLNSQLGTVTGALNEQLSQTRGNIGRQLDSTQHVVSKVQERLGELSATARHMHDLGKDIARLQDILQAPKLRGNLGELFLEDLLSQVLPSGSFSMQHSFSSGEKVDAVIRLGSHLVPVDSKFPLESFSRLQQAPSEAEKKKGRREFAASVRKRVDEIADKYIRPDEGTYDFALMYIPAENVFYEIIIRDDALEEGQGIFNYALRRHVVPVSPNSFYAYLMSVAYGLKGLQIEKQAEEIRGQMAHLRTGLDKFSEDFQVLGRHLENARGKHAEAERKLGRLHDSFHLLTGGGDGHVEDHDR